MAKQETGVHSRREFLEACAVASAVPLFAGGVATAWAESLLSPAAAPQFYKVLFDRESPAAVAFGRRARGIQLPAVEVGREVTSLWYDDLYHRWREGPAAIAGLTVPHVAFCLEILARDVGMRVMYRGEHSPLGDGRIHHRFKGPADLLAKTSLLDADWTHGTAQWVGCCQATLERTEAEYISVAGHNAIDEPLVSWVIAPRSSRT